MATVTTLTTAKAWHPDVQAILPADAIPTALILTDSTVVGSIEGDEPAVRVPFISATSKPGFVPEGTEIPEGSGTLDEAVVHTGKLATLGTFSREQLAQPNATKLIVDSMSASIIESADAAYLNNAISATSPTGILKVAGITNGGAVGANLDTLIDAIASIESNGGTASSIIMAPDAWAAMSKLKTATGSAENLLGAGLEAGDRRVLGVPVKVNAQAPAGTVVVMDKRAVVSAVGNVLVARSDDAKFTSDSVVVRVTFRIGWTVARPKRVVKLTTTAV